MNTSTDNKTDTTDKSVNDEVIGKAYDPIGDAKVNEKSYGGQAGLFTEQQLGTDIPEPSFGTGAKDFAEMPGASMPQSEKKDPKKQQPQQPFNEEVHDLPDSQKKAAARKMAEMLVDGYANLKKQGVNLITIPDRKVQKLIRGGLINPKLVVPVSPTAEMSLGAFFEFYNDQCRGLFETSDDFREAILPPLERELSKRGHGMTDMQQIIFIVVQDLFFAGVEAFKTRMVLTDMLNFAKEHSAANKGKNPPQAAASQQPETSAASASVVGATEASAPGQQENAEQAQVKITEEPAQTLQEKALANVHFIPAVAKNITPASKGGGKTGAPQYGKKQVLKRIEKTIEDGEAAGKRAEKNATRILKAATKKVTTPKPESPPTGEKRGKGRPKGSTNKKKNIPKV